MGEKVVRLNLSNLLKTAKPENISDSVFKVDPLSLEEIKTAISLLERYRRMVLRRRYSGIVQSTIQHLEVLK